MCVHKYRSSTGRDGSVEVEVEGGEGTKAPNLQGHLSKIENVNNESGRVRFFFFWSLKM